MGFGSLLSVGARGDDLIMDAVAEDAKRLLAPHIKLLTKRMVDIESRIQRVQELLLLGQHNDHSGKCLLAGIHGMGGVGKTTLALAVHDQAATDFSGRRIYFPIGALCTSKTDLRDKRCQLLQSLSGATTKPAFDSELEECNCLRTALRSSGTLLLILDDLWTKEQLRWLLACDEMEDPKTAVANLPAGSRVLLTSRYKSFVSVDGHEERLIHHAVLSKHFAEQLLRQNVFATGSAPLNFTASQMEQALGICGGLPLALQVLGRQLRHTQKQNWQVDIKFPQPITLCWLISLVVSCNHCSFHLQFVICSDLIASPIGLAIRICLK